MLNNQTNTTMEYLDLLIREISKKTFTSVEELKTEIALLPLVDLGKMSNKRGNRNYYILFDKTGNRHFDLSYNIVNGDLQPCLKDVSDKL